jgi:hypothetical protein
MRIMTGGAVGDATKKLFKVPFINDDCNLDALSAMLDKIEKREQVAQQFLAIPSNWVAWYIEKQTGYEIESQEVV